MKAFMVALCLAVLGQVCFANDEAIAAAKSHLGGTLKVDVELLGKSYAPEVKLVAEQFD